MVQKTNISEDIRQSIKALIEEARRISADVAEEVEEILQQGKENPLAPDEASVLLTKVINVLKHSASKRGDEAASKSLDGDINQIVEQMIQIRDQVMQGTTDLSCPTKKLKLITHNGIRPRSVQPVPCFQGRLVPMESGFVKATDIQLWDQNDRLQIHLGQFRQKNGRDPDPDEVRDIMQSKMDLPGIPEEEKDDQFKIVPLARSIAVNGVRTPPIIDMDGTLLDGNRRVTACYYILNSDEFTVEEKRRAEYIFVWQLTEHATDDDRGAVVVARNFEPDCKQDWPEYIKARKVYEEWQAMLSLAPRLPTPQQLAQMKKELSKKFALGPNTDIVNRYIKMVDWANDFEDYHINHKRRDTYEVQHRSNEYFQYFDELARGERPGGVAYALNQDDGFKHTVFDLVFDSKFRNAKQIRDLKLIFNNEEARDYLARARSESDPDRAEDHIEDAITIARSRRAETRELGANTRIETFVDWLEELPVRAFRDRIKPENLRRLLSALKLVERQAAEILRDEDVDG
ncbi:hypothetical protein [Iningainema tapete]|uniref:ParB/Sulfiredoxin domain-containing protein n=1 Tax=Iningainema tapete BLCC-T55 TaxID=2748662 RepID=A0A8J7C4C9_9CYAN|nr:hypothetical protein [Iningainema tapete]MBD2771299.1 hypothetical protein [Iningainema tapete BLCC-T55]